MLNLSVSMHNSETHTSNAPYFIIIEYPLGSDKGVDGFRPDTKPMLNSIKKYLKADGEIVFYNHDKRAHLSSYISNKATTVISRINPGNLKEVDDYFVFLDELSKKGIQVETHPEVMIQLDFKDILVKLKNTVVGDSSTFFYPDFNSMKAQFPDLLAKDGIRVLKTNYGSTGEGVYLVKLMESKQILCTEAVNNQSKTYASIDDFMVDFEPRFSHPTGNEVFFEDKYGFVDCRYLARIAEGEIRVLLVKNQIVSIVHKKPQEGGFSATLFSGATYVYEDPKSEKWHDVVCLTEMALDDIKTYTKGHSLPLLWTIS